MTYLHTDHLGTVSLATSGGGQVLARTLNLPYGGVRWSSGAMPTDYGFTGMKENTYIKLIQMGARWYDPELGRWLSSDTIVPDPSSPQQFNRFSYVSNNPVKYTDPTGHCQLGWDDQGNLIITKDDCTVEEFENNLDWNQRILWLQTFARMHGLGSWFNDITAVLQFFRDDPDFSLAGGWAYRADAAVLQAIQDGWRIKEGKDPIGFSLGVGDATLKISGGQKWATFFQMANDGSVTGDNEDVLARLDAEQMGADYAWLTALHLYEAADQLLQNKIGVFKQNADFYRIEFVPSHRNSVFQWRGGIFDPRTANGVVSVLAPALSVSSELGYQFNTCLVIFCQ